MSAEKVEEQFDAFQKEEIAVGEAENIDTSIYAHKEYLSIQMRELRLGLEEELDVSYYANPAYDWFQMKEIRKGMLDQIDVTKYAKPEIPYDKMRELRHALRKGVDLTTYVKLPAGMIRELRKALVQKVDIIPYIKEGYDAGQLREIRHALNKELNICPYITPEFRPGAIYEIRKALNKQLDPTCFATMEYSWQQMREIRLGMEKRLDYTQYENSLYSCRQMREIRLGLEEGIDVSKYKTFMYDSQTMHQVRKKMLEEKEQGNSVSEELTQENDSLPDGMFIQFENHNREAYLQITKVRTELPTKVKFLTLLYRNGVRFGILEEVVDALLQGKVISDKILIAKGKDPISGKDGYYEFFVGDNIVSLKKLNVQSQIDYENVNLFTKVSKGQRLAVYYSATAGEDGYDVTGKKLVAEKGKNLSMLKGSGIYLSEDRMTYFAKKDGAAEHYGDKLVVSDLLELESVTSVDGPITFDGCVHVKKSVGSGGSITASGSIVVDYMVLGGSLKSKKDILIRKGVNGGTEQNSCIIQTGGGLISGYIESMQVKTKDSIYTNYCLHSILYSENKIFCCGDKGRIIGGKTTALLGIVAQSSGNEAEVPTEIKLGICEKDLEHLQTLQEKIKEKTKQLELLNMTYVKYMKLYAAEVRNTMPVVLKIENAIETIAAEKKEHKRKVKILNGKIDMSKKASVLILGNVNVGTNIVMEEHFLVAGNMNCVEFRNVGGKIIICKPEE